MSNHCLNCWSHHRWLIRGVSDSLDTRCCSVSFFNFIQNVLGQWFCRFKCNYSVYWSTSVQKVVKVSLPDFPPKKAINFIAKAFFFLFLFRFSLFPFFARVCVRVYVCVSESYFLTKWIPLSWSDPWYASVCVLNGLCLWRFLVMLIIILIAVVIIWQKKLQVPSHTGCYFWNYRHNQCVLEV